MSTNATAERPPSRRRRLVATLWIGLGLTLLATAYPFVDRVTTRVLTDHIQASYPDYSMSRLSTAATTYLIILVTIGGLAVLGWLATIRAVRAGKRWAPWLATGLLVAGLGIALAALTVTDTSGDVGLAPALGWLQLAPCIAGIAAVVMLWRKPR